MTAQYEVVVVGGGTAGVVAAVQAARAGARTLLVEKTGQLGGTVTSGGVNAPASFHGWGRQVIAGIGWELVTRALREDGRDPAEVQPGGSAFGQDGSRPNPVHIRINAPLFALLCDEAVRRAGAALRFHTMLAAAAWQPEDGDGGGWRLTLCGKEGLSEVTAAVLIDASGDANAVQLAGFPVERPEELQPATPVVRFTGYEPADLDEVALRRAIREAVAEGAFQPWEFGWGGEHAEDRLLGRLRRGFGNALHVPGLDGVTSEGRSRMEQAGHELVLRLYRWLRRQPGLEGLRITEMAPEVGVRETVVIQGKRRVTVEEYLAGHVYEDAVCYSFYPVDIHCLDGKGTRNRPVQEGAVPTLPRGAMLPAGSRNLLAPGRHACGDREANSSYRVEAPCMAMGQAAGALAVLAARAGCDVEAVPMPELRCLLREHEAIVPGPAD